MPLKLHLSFSQRDVLGLVLDRSLVSRIVDEVENDDGEHNHEDAKDIDQISLRYHRVLRVDILAGRRTCKPCRVRPIPLTRCCTP